MRARTLHRVVLAVALAAFAAACTKPRVVTQPAEPSGLVLLLPDPDDGTVGRAAVSNNAGSVDLSNAYEATRVAANRAPTPAAVMEKAEVDRLFRDVLASLPPAPRHFTLNFELGNDELTAQSRALVPEVLQTVRQRPVPEIIVVGHTDTTGTAASNYDLGLRRAAIVRDLLVSAGVDASAITVTSHGEGDLLVPTRDDVNEPRNRRVEIDIQ